MACVEQRTRIWWREGSQAAYRTIKSPIPRSHMPLFNGLAGLFAFSRAGTLRYAQCSLRSHGVLLLARSLSFLPSP
eukprot:3323170-Rhodomonas_salina.1